jgi:hypothetical protein
VADDVTFLRYVLEAAWASDATDFTRTFHTVTQTMASTMPLDPLAGQWTLVEQHRINRLHSEDIGLPGVDLARTFWWGQYTMAITFNAAMSGARA